MHKAILIHAYRNLNPADKKKCLTVVLLMAISAFLDFFSLASFLPLIFFIVNPDFIASNTVVSKLYFHFNFPGTTSFIIAATSCVLFLVLMKNLISVLISSAKIRYAFGIGNDLSSRALERYIEMNYLSFSEGDFTRELNRIANYPRAYANNIVLPLTSLISEGLVSLFILTGIAFYDIRVLALVSVILLPTILLYRMRRSQLKEINESFKEKNPLLFKYALQVVEGFSEIKVYKKQRFFLERFEAMNRNITGILIKDQFIQDYTLKITEVVMAIIVCSLVIYSVSIQQDYQHTLMLMGIYAGASFRIFPSVNRILHASQQIRTHEYLFEEFEATMSFRPPQNRAASPAPVFDKTVELRNVSFAYTNLHPVLQNLSFLLHKGERIGLTGKSGEGKTTILLLLLGLLKETGGEILVDGKSLDGPDNLRDLFGYVPQNPYLLDGTMAENIAFGVSPENINRVKVRALIHDLGLQEMTDRLPDGIDTRIGERGIKLSGGQVQRLSIARALYVDTDILLLDEITNQLHPSIELEIMNLLHGLAEKGTTIIMVTHKLPNPRFFDSIYRLEKGKLVEVAIHS